MILQSREKDLFRFRRIRVPVPRNVRVHCERIFFMNPEQPPSAIAVSSASPQEGKSTVSIALATTMAQSGSKTLLVDADARHPQLQDLQH